MLAARCEIAVAWDDGSGGHLARAGRREVEAFCDALVEHACGMAPGDEPEPCFVLGMACAVDALASGRLDLGDPVGAAEAAWADADPANAHVPPSVTDAVLRYWRGAA